MDISIRIGSLRRGVGISQEILAERLGVSRQAVTKWESGDAVPDLENLIRLCREFGISVDSLLHVEGDCGVGGEAPARPVPELVAFLCRAKRATYAGAGAETASSRQASHDLSYSEGDLRYLDTYLGSEHFAGQEAIWNKGLPTWAMNYGGRVLDGGFSGDFLKAALAKVDVNLPYRGPNLFVVQDKVYHCEVEGDFHWFQGVESIFHGTTKVYECRFHGGLVR